MEKAVELNYPAEDVAVVVMQDRQHSNTFSPELLEGLMTAFDAVAKNPRLKVVVVHGYDTIFCAGGTQEELLAIADRKVQVAGTAFYRLLLDCELPVIAAMQGHAIGGGLVFGLFADIIILAEEAIYAANFMKYGFTPGMGATLILPEKVGLNLANEMMFNARTYHGGELRARGVPFQIVKRGEVIQTALRLAGEIADKPLPSLKLLKRHMTARLVAALPRIIQQELEMHAVTFTQPEVRRRIETQFGN